MVLQAQDCGHSVDMTLLKMLSQMWTSAAAHIELSSARYSIRLSVRRHDVTSGVRSFRSECIHAGALRPMYIVQNHPARTPFPYP